MTFLKKIFLFLGEYLFSNLKTLVKEYPNLINSVRGLGTFGAFNGADTKIRDEIIIKLRNTGVHAGPCGPLGVRMRPSLIFTKKHADIVIDTLRSVLKTF